MSHSIPGPSKAAVGLALAALAGGCSANGMPTLQSLLPPPIETNSTAAAAAAPSAPTETSLSVPGTPTNVFAQVAQGMLGCWFGSGPLKASHVYRAEAEPPTKGGEAEIVIHERDLTLRDQRGTRAYKVMFAGEGSGVRVTIMPLKIEAKLAEAMARDVETWAKEGVKPGAACQLRALFPPPPPPTAMAKATKPAKGAAAKNAAAKSAPARSSPTQSSPAKKP
jgi:hypothetical protein